MKFKLEKKYILRGITAFLVVAGGIFLYYLIFHGSNIKSGMGYLYSICIPIVNGLVIAYIMTPTLNYIEKKIIIRIAKKCGIDTHKHRVKLRAVSILITALLFVAVVYAMFAMLISQIVPSIRNIINNFDTYVGNLTRWVNRLFEDNKDIANFIQDTIKTYSVEFETWLSDTLLPQTSEIIRTLSMSVLSFLKLLWNLIIGFVISIYLLFNKEVLAGQAKKIVYAVLNLKAANIFVREVRFVHRTFTGFISGKVVDSIIIGLLCFIGTTIIGTPYAALVSIIIGVTNVIPFFGPYLGAVPSAIFILIVDLSNPMNCVYFIIFILILQQFDGNILGPKILGDSTGLSGFWVIFAITFFGGLFGVFGMIIGVPIFAVIYSIVGRLVNHQLEKRKLPTETSLYLSVGSIDSDSNFVAYVAPDGSLNKMFSRKEESSEVKERRRLHLENLFRKHYRQNQDQEQQQSTSDDDTKKTSDEKD